MEKNKEIQIQIKSIKEICFSQSHVEETSSFEEELKFSFGFSIKVNKEDNLVDIMVGVRYGHLDKIILECQYSIVFLIDGFNEVIFIEEGKQEFQADDNFIATLLAVGFGTLRGIVVVKTAGTILNNYPFPIVNPTEIAQTAKLTKQ